MTGPVDPSHTQAADDEPTARPHPESEAKSSASVMPMAQAGKASHRVGPYSCHVCGGSIAPSTRSCMACGTRQFFDPDLAYGIRRAFAPVPTMAGAESSIEGQLRRRRHRTKTIIIWYIGALILLISTSFVLFYVQPPGHHHQPPARPGIPAQSRSTPSS